MSVKRYGIYLAYAPTVDLRAEGLGRHLAALLEAAAKRSDIRFVVACPSWTRESVLQLCESEGIAASAFDLVSPSRKPALLRIYEGWQKRKLPRRRRLIRWWSAYAAWLSRRVTRMLSPWRRAIIGSRSLGPLLIVGSLVALVAAVVAPFLFAWNVLRRAGTRLAALGSRVTLRGYLAVVGKTTERAARELIAGRAPKDVPTVLTLYRQMQEVEVDAMHRLIDALPDVIAWYCPTAFWPTVTTLSRPQLICVPDVVLTDFAASFSELGGDRLLDTFRQIESTLALGRHFVTYSDYVKRQTLVQRFGVAPSAVDVVNHGAIRLDPLIYVRGSNDPERATDAFCRDLLNAVLRRAVPAYRPGIVGEDTRFLFYASQFRPHKNVINLLRACDHLLHRRYVGCKLVLTGNPEAAPEILEHAARLGLSDEVVFLHRLAPQELAACYRLAALAVNPSLFEGGLPFTFSEAVSVGTPVVMARIPVTTESIDDEALSRDMLFDPYDWRDMASRIEWALDHRTGLIERQRSYYDRRVASRTWDDALNDYVALLDRVGTDATRPPGP